MFRAFVDSGLLHNSLAPEEVGVRVGMRGVFSLPLLWCREGQEVSDYAMLI